MWARYNALLTRYPLPTKAASGFVLAGTGDVLAQSIEKQQQEATTTSTNNNNKPHGLRRLAVFAAFGAAWTGPVNHYWLAYLARTFPGATASSVARKLVVQHALWNPLWYLPFYFGFIGVGLGKSAEEIWQWVQRDYWGMLVSCWLVWIPITGAMFVAVPERLQSVLMSAISLGWNSFLSWRTLSHNSSSSSVVTATGD